MSMKYFTASVLTAAFLAIGQPARAEGGGAEDGKRKWGYYVTGRAGGSWATADAAGATLAGGPIAGSSQDESAFGGAALGTIVDLGPVDLRLELEGTGVEGRRSAGCEMAPG